MGKITITVLHTGKVCVPPELPFGGDNCNIIKASSPTILCYPSDKNASLCLSKIKVAWKNGKSCKKSLGKMATLAQKSLEKVESFFYFTDLHRIEI